MSFQRISYSILFTLLSGLAYGSVSEHDLLKIQDSLQVIGSETTEYSEIEQHISDYHYYRGTDPKKALRSIKDATRMAAKNFSNEKELSHEEMILWQRSEALLSQAYYDKGRYLEAEEHLNKVIEINENVLDPALAIDYSEKRIKLDSILETLKFSRTKQWLHNIDPLQKVGDAIEGTNLALKANMEAKLFRTYAAKGMIISADKHYQKAIEFYDQTGNNDKLEILRLEYEAWKDELGVSVEEEELNIAQDIIGIELNERLDSLREEAAILEKSAKFKGNSALLQRYRALQKDIADEEKRNAIALLEKVNQLENQDREILLLVQENELSQLTLAQERTKIEEATRKKRNLSIGLGLLSALAISLFFLYRNKTRSNEKLRVARDELAYAKERVASLLQEQVSGDIADALIEEGDSLVQERFVSVMFVDIRDFTPKVAQMRPKEINKYQNDIFGFMIDIVEAHHGNINQLLGDGFMATFGAPKSVGNDVQNSVNAGSMILENLSKMNLDGKVPETKIGIGIDCGKAVMGNVGNDSRKQFSITGNVVISAARIEQSNKVLGSSFLISKAVKEKSEISKVLVEHSVALKGRNGQQVLFEVLDN